jgi:hypothetical protein
MAKEPHYKLQLGFKLYPLQQEIVDHLNGLHKNPAGDDYRFLAAVFGRQSGKSFFCKVTALDWAINRKKRVMWVAPSIPTARAHWNDLVGIIEASGLKVKRISHSTKEIQFYGGGSISIRSAVQPNNLRGATVDLLILDEAAFFQDGEYVWYSVCQPMITASKGKVLFASTPNGRNWFFDVFSQGQDPTNEYFKSWRAPSTASPYQDRKLLEHIKRHIPNKKWREEYLAEFLADAGGVFSGVEEAATAEMIKKPLPGHSYVVGIDIGFVNDETVFTVLDEFTREQVYGESWSNVGTLSTLRRIGHLLDIWRPKVTMFEKNGLGETFFDLIRQVFSGRDPDLHLLDVIYQVDKLASGLSDDDDTDPRDADEDEVMIRRGSGTNKVQEVRAGGHVLRGVHMDNLMKRAFVDGLSADIEYGRLKILRDDNEFGRKQINQMSTYERKNTASGMSVTYAAQEGAHDDCVSALYLARKALPRMSQQRVVDDEEIKPKKNPFRSGSKVSTGRRWNKGAR